MSELMLDNAVSVEESPAPRRTEPVTRRTPVSWWHVADGSVLAIWIVLVGFTLHYHEKWADEAQAWLIARDLGLRTIWFHELRYEGSPGLWHTLLWVAQHVFHLGYGSLGLIGMAGAAAGAALLIFKAPFPRYLRWPLAFTYVMVYQYAVIARPYTLLPLLAFAAALVFKDLRHPERMTVILVLLANLSLHGTIIAGCLGLVYLIDARKAWRTFDARLQKRYWVCVGIVALTFLSIVLLLKPTPDIEEFVIKREFAQLPAEARAQIPSVGRKLTAVITGAFLDYPIPSALFILFSPVWCFFRRRLLVFVLPVGALITFYTLVHGAAHHHGAVFVAAVAAIWIAWPEAWVSLDTRQRWVHRGMIVFLLSLAGVNMWDATITIDREMRYPYSGAEDAAYYLRSVGADHGPMFGFLFGVVGVQAFFDHNIFANMPTAYFHHGLPLAGTNLDLEALRRVKPEYLVAYSQEPELMARYGLPQLLAEGYETVHFSDGYYLYKRSVYEREVYFILRRQHGDALPGSFGNSE